jgi:hypothetical protein
MRVSIVAVDGEIYFDNDEYDQTAPPGKYRSSGLIFRRDNLDTNPVARSHYVCESSLDNGRPLGAPYRIRRHYWCRRFWYSHPQGPWCLRDELMTVT